MKTRINKKTRAYITESILANMSKQRRDIMRPLENKVFPVLYSALLRMHKLDEGEVRAVPAGWLPTLNHIHFSWFDKNAFVQAPVYWHWPIPFAAPRQAHQSPRVTFDNLEPNEDWITADAEMYARLYYELRSVNSWSNREKVSAMLSGYKTVEDLLTDIPQLKAHIPDTPKPEAEPIEPKHSLMAVAQYIKDLML